MRRFYGFTRHNSYNRHIFCYNIAYGILFGLIGYTVGQVAVGKAKQLSKTIWVLTALFVIYLMLDIIL